MAKRAFSHARMRMCVCKKQSLFNEQDVGQQGLSAAFRDLGRERRRSVLLTRADLIKLNPNAPPKKSGRRQHTHTHTHTHWCMYVSVPTLASLSSHYCNNGFQKRLLEKPQSMSHSNSQIPTNKMEDKTLLKVISRTKKSDMVAGNINTTLNEHNSWMCFGHVLNL